jgi:hypothetical protein
MKLESCIVRQVQPTATLTKAISAPFGTGVICKVAEAFHPGFSSAMNRWQPRKVARSVTEIQFTSLWTQPWLCIDFHTSLASRIGMPSWIFIVDYVLLGVIVKVRSICLLRYTFCDGARNGDPRCTILT